MKKIFIIFIFSVVFAACETGRSFRIVMDKTDPITKKHVYMTEHNDFKVEYPGACYISLDMYSTGVDIGLGLNYFWSGRMLITKGESLVFNVDGEIIKFKSESGSMNNKVVKGMGGTYYSEFAVYRYDRKKLEKIANGKNVVGRVIGSKLQLDFTVTEKNKTNFKAMLAAVK